MYPCPSASRLAARWKKRGSPSWFSESGATASANTARTTKAPAAMTASRRPKGVRRRTPEVWQVAKGQRRARMGPTVEASIQPAKLESFNPAGGERVGAVATTDPAKVQAV